MKRLVVFAKGNVVLRDSLLAAREDGEVRWNGLNEVLRPKGVRARVKHETFSRSDIVLQGPRADIPEALQRAPLDLGAYPLHTQLSSQLFAEGAAPDVVVLGVQADAMNIALRHRESGLLFFPGFGLASSGPECIAWVRANCEPVERLSADEVVASMERLVTRIQERGVGLVVVTTTTLYSPGLGVACYDGIEETLAERAAAINLGVCEVSRRTSCAVLDVARIAREHGEKNVQVDTWHFTAKGSEYICREFGRVLEQEGLA